MWPEIVTRTQRVAFELVRALCLATSAFALFPCVDARAQIPEEEHASHHPGAASAAVVSDAAPAAAMTGASAPDGMAAASAPDATSASSASGAMTGAAGALPAAAPAGAGGMMAEMGEMMKTMGKSPPKEFYPSLMSMPELVPEQRAEIEQQATERMYSGIVLMGQALDALGIGARSNDYVAMRAATTQLREGLGQFESGTAARRVLAEGSTPRDVAQAWFKQEMSLSPGARGETSGFLGVSTFHLLMMVLLVVFMLAMLVMYFVRIRRAAALFGRIEPDAGSPPPGSSAPAGAAVGP